MRFYFEDHVGGNVATKCLRVCSSSSTHELIETLSEKFRPDMKMLTTSYSLYEIHASKGNDMNGHTHCLSGGHFYVFFPNIFYILFVEQERKLDAAERPLAVQLNWTTDNKAGRFVLKKEKESLEVMFRALTCNVHSPFTQSQTLMC